MNTINELSKEQIDIISGGINSGQGSFGAGLLGVAVGIAAITPIGALSIAAVTFASFGGGFLVGNSIANDGDTDWIF